MRKCMSVILFALMVFCMACGHAEPIPGEIDIMPVDGLCWGDSVARVKEVVGQDLVRLDNGRFPTVILSRDLSEDCRQSFAFIHHFGKVGLVLVSYDYNRMSEQAYLDLIAEFTEAYGAPSVETADDSLITCTWSFEYLNQDLTVKRRCIDESDEFVTVYVGYFGEVPMDY